MNDALKTRIQSTVQGVVRLLVSKEYAKIEQLSSGIRLRAEHIAAGVEEYGRTLKMPPEDAYRSMRVVQVKGKKPDEFYVRFDLHTEEEGRSDLSLEMTVIDDDGGREELRVEIDNIHVL